jgi:DivIVA domain-containing protein
VVHVARDRQRIERKDFPIGRRGYDPDAVDAHLAALADEVDELKRSSRRRTETLAAAASEQVRAIVEAAESSAAEIQRQAEDEALEIRTEASSEARTMREQATSQARDYVGRVSESTTTMLGRLEAMEGELGALIEALRTGGNRLNADLQLLENNLEEVRDAVQPRPRFEPEPVGGHGGSRVGATAAPVRSATGEEPWSDASRADAWRADASRGEVPQGEAPRVSASDALEPEAESAKRQGDALESIVGEAAGAPEAGGPNADDEDARLVALNMALNGTPREETERYLAENFRVHDRRGLLDEVYASVGG